MDIFFIDTETISKKEENLGEDILCQLAYLHINKGFSKIDSGYMKPKIASNSKSFNIECASITGITEEFLEDKKRKEETESWKYLKENLESSEKKVLVFHNAEFDLEVLKRADINPINATIIDTLRIAEIINDIEKLPREYNRLSYIIYFYKLYLKREEAYNKFGLNMKNTKSHDALFDIIDLYLVYKLFMSYNNFDFADFVGMSNTSYVLDYVPYGKNRGELFEELSWNQLKYYATLDGNIGYTAKSYMGEH